MGHSREQKLATSKEDISRLQPGKEEYRDYIEPPENAEIVRKVVRLAENKGVKPGQIALSWLIHKGVVPLIVGTVNPEHLQEAAEALEIDLSDGEIKYLEEPYKPKPVTGHHSRDALLQSQDSFIV